MELSYSEWEQIYPTDDLVVSYYKESYILHIGIFCTFCSRQNYSQRTNKRTLYHCNDCNNSFTFYADSIFYRSKTSMVKWFYLINYLISENKNITSHQLKNRIGVTYKTAYRMIKKVKEALQNKHYKKTYEHTLMLIYKQP